jgi:hypothetical protein
MIPGNVVQKDLRESSAVTAGERRGSHRRGQ